MSVKHQDDLEGEILTSFLNPRLLAGLVRPDVLVGLVLVLLTCGAVYLTSRLWSIEDWLSICGGGKDQALAHKSDGDATSGSPSVGAYGIRGRRPSMEDRIISGVVKVQGKGGNVAINAVLDGHGGQFSADFARRHLVQSLDSKIRLLKMLSSESLPAKHKLMIYEMAQKKKDGDKTNNAGGGGGGGVTKRLLRTVGMSEAEYKQLRPGGSILDGPDKTKLTPKSSPSKKTDSPSKTPTSDSLVLSSRVKPIEETPSVKGEEETEEEDGIESILTLNTSSTSGSARKSKKKSRKTLSKDISEYLNDNGKILYASLLKDEVAAADKALLAECGKNGHLGGTTLLLTVLDSGTLWVANVGDSRGVMANMAKGSSSSNLKEDDSAMKLLSYDHKPSQLKERKRIEDAGGFVAMNGVWRVQGILAVSRALGDLPLKAKNLITCEPDVLSFNMNKDSLVVLATDGLWDVMSNEEAAELARRNLEKLQNNNLKKKESNDKISKGEMLALVCRGLAEAAYDRGSTDNVTIVAVKMS